jgi:protein-L-isoaspartate(D-aspartate) O-methyltransferase
MNSLRQNGIGMTSQRTRTRMIERLREQGIKDELVLSAMNSVPRHMFVEEAISHFAYDDKSLPIGHAQTISQPYIVARMIEVLRDGKHLNRVLEIGTGCGYQAAVLAHVAREVHTVERILPLYERASGTLKELSVTNVKSSYSDGVLGLPEMAPFDGIIMAAAATHIPQALLDQLAVGGRMVLPVGAQEQTLHLIERDTQGYRESRLEKVKFVPLLMGRA